MSPEEAANSLPLRKSINAVTNVLVTLVAIALVDKVGRRPMLLAGSVGMTVSLGAMALAFTQGTADGTDLTLPAPWGPVALVAGEYEWLKTD